MPRLGLCAYGRLPGFRVVSDPGVASRALHTLERRAHLSRGLSGFAAAIAEHEMAHSICEAEALLSGDDDRRLAAVARMSDPFARLSLMLGIVRRALTGLVHVLFTAAESLLARLISSTLPSWQPTDRAIEVDLSPAGPLVRARTVLTAAPPIQPFATVGTTAHCHATMPLHAGAGHAALAVRDAVSLPLELDPRLVLVRDCASNGVSGLIGQPVWLAGRRGDDRDTAGCGSEEEAGRAVG